MKFSIFYNYFSFEFYSSSVILITLLFDAKKISDTRQGTTGTSFHHTPVQVDLELTTETSDSQEITTTIGRNKITPILFCFMQNHLLCYIPRKLSSFHKNDYLSYEIKAQKILSSGRTLFHIES